jgi:hypothetical protein
MSTLVIVGTDHFPQPVMLADNFSQFSDAHARHVRQARYFRNFVAEKIGKFGIGFLAEEYPAETLTVARELAIEHECRWISIHTTTAKRSELGMTKDYRVRLSRSELAEVDQKREDVMASQIIEGRPADSNVLVICGSDHVEGLYSRLRDFFEKIVCCDTSKESWYENPKQFA